MRTRLSIALAAVALLAGAVPALASGPRADTEMYQAVIDARTRGKEAYRLALLEESERAEEASRLRAKEFAREEAATRKRQAPKEEPPEPVGFPWVILAFGAAAAVGLVALRRRKHS